MTRHDNHILILIDAQSSSGLSRYKARKMASQLCIHQPRPAVLLQRHRMQLLSQ